MKFIKVIIGVIIFSLLEVLSYYKFEPKMIENFFTFWAVLPFVLLLWNVFNFESNPSTDMLGAIGSKTPNLKLQQAIGEKDANNNFDREYNIKNKKKSNFINNIFTPFNIICILLFTSNVIGYLFA